MWILKFHGSFSDESEKGKVNKEQYLCAENFSQSFSSTAREMVRFFPHGQQTSLHYVSHVISICQPTDQAHADSLRHEDVQMC